MEEWIVVPGQYSGDMWHAAAAALVNPRLGIIVAVGRDDKDIKGVGEITKFFTDIGLRDRLEIVEIKPSKTVFVDGEEAAAADVPGKALAWQYLGAVQAQRPGSRDRLHIIYRSTSFIMRAIEEHGRDQVLNALGIGLTHGLSRIVRKLVVRYAAKVLKPFKKKNVLFVLGRVAKYNTQHDLSVERLTAIAQTAKLGGFSLVIVGGEEGITGVADEAGLTKGVDYICLDLRDWTTLTGSDVLEERARAYFWRCVVALARSKDFGINVKLVGGRSGSTDIAAFMGVDCLSWDVFDVFNPEYLRLLITAPCLLQVTHIGEDLNHGVLLLKPKPSPQFVSDLSDFLKGAFKPCTIEFGLSGSGLKKPVNNRDSKEQEILQSFMKVFSLIYVVRTDGPWIVVDTRPKAFLALHVALSGDWEEPYRLVDLFKLIAYVDGSRRRGLSNMLEASERLDPLTVYFDLDEL